MVPFPSSSARRHWRNPLSDAAKMIDSHLPKISPSTLIAATVGLYALSSVSKSLQEEWGKTRRERVGDLCLRLSYVQKLYDKGNTTLLSEFQGSVKKQWKQFGVPITEIPDKGWSEEELMGLIERYSESVTRALEGKQLSGAIYSTDSLREETKMAMNSSSVRNLGSEESGDFLPSAQTLKNVFTEAFKKSYFWNTLHGDEFAIGNFIEYQVVRMVANLFGGKPNEVMGFVTSGGTESLMLAMRAYRDWGIKNRKHQPGEGVVIASKSVHAAILKASRAYLFKVELIDTDASGHVNIKQLAELVKKHGNKVIAMIGSAPSYPLGVVDPISEMAKIASDNGCGMHVDCCLGAFVLNNFSDHNTSYLTIPGVTSLSADTHKNGLAPKGSSVLVTKKIGDTNLAYYSFYSHPEWRGGVYGTPKDAGSQSCVNSLNALLAMLGTGKLGYKQMAELIRSSTTDLAALIRSFNGKLKLIAEPKVNVVAFKIDETWGLQKGATYAFVHEMAKRNFVLNTLSDDQAQFCVTLRFSTDSTALSRFEKAIKESLDEVETLNRDGRKFPGDAGMYCALEAAMNPNQKVMTFFNFLQNYLLGRQGAKDAVRMHFLARQNPYV